MGISLWGFPYGIFLWEFPRLKAICRLKKAQGPLKMETDRQNFPLWDFPYGNFLMGFSLWEFPDFAPFGLISEAWSRIRPKPLISQDLPRWSKTCVSVVKNHQISTFWRLLPIPSHERWFRRVQNDAFLMHFLQIS